MTKTLTETVENLVAVGTLPLGILTALFVGWKPSVVVFVVGWLLLLPAVNIVGDFLGTYTDESSSEDESDVEPTDPLTELKQRYALGEIDDVEFERKVAKLVETEDVEIDGDVDFDRDQTVERIRE